MLKRVILAAVVLLVLADILAVIPATRNYVRLKFSGSVCTLDEYDRGLRYLRSTIAAGERFEREIRPGETDGELQAFDTPQGRFWCPVRSVASLPLMLAEQENRLYGSGDRGVRRGDIVLDCGANVGAFTRTALRAGAEVVVAIEPAPDNLQCLRRTFASEVKKGRVVVYPKGVWDKNDTLRLEVTGNSENDTLVLHPDASTGWMVPLTTIDQIVVELRLPRVDFIKMDIEGAEKWALRGGRKTLLQYRPRLSIATEHLPDDATAIPASVRAIAPQYRQECGPCYARFKNPAQPDVIYFY
jgi:FkbM family methyltransferase